MAKTTPTATTHNPSGEFTTSTKGNKMAKKMNKKTVTQQPATRAIVERKLSEADMIRRDNYEGSVLMQALSFALRIKRPHKGAGEAMLLNYIYAFASTLQGVAEYGFDTAGNLHVDMREPVSGDPCARSRSLFIAHTDTVHRMDGDNAIEKTPSVWYASGSQLGADDGAGVAILMHMMANGVRGYYAFTIGEECGGVGAKALGKDEAFLAEFDRAVAFDRRDTTSVISHQGCGRCCSDAFAEALSDSLNAQGMLMMPDDTGVYTDTAEFVDVIPECTNISVGYMREHSAQEAQDILFLRELADAVLGVDWENLPTERDIAAQAAEEAARWTAYRYASGSTPTYGSMLKDDAQWGGMGVGGFDSMGAWGEYDFDDYVSDTEANEALYDALVEAMCGSTVWLVELMAHAVYPEDIDMAIKTIGMYRISMDAMKEAVETLLETEDAHTTLMALFDAISEHA